MKKYNNLFFIIFGVFLILSCPKPMLEESLLQVKDMISPVITIKSPEEGAFYASTIVVEGSVSDTADSEETSGAVSTLQYEVLSTSIADAVELADDGTFTFSFPADNLSGSVTIVLTAEDWNGNITAVSITLVDGGNDIPSFQVAPGNKQAVLAWDEVTLSEEYIIHELVSGSSYSGAVSPYTVTGLKNGYQYTFMLESVSSSGENNISEEISCIPLSENTLIPAVKGEYDGIRLSWSTIPGTDRYQVFRTMMSGTGPFYPVSGALSASSYFDTQTEPGEKYYYAVAPFEQRDILSAPARGTRAFFPRDNQRLSFPVCIPGASYSADVTVQGNYLYTAEGSTKKKIGIFDISQPDKPVYSGDLSMPNTPAAVFSDDAYLYVCGYNFFRIYSITAAPAAPYLAYSYTFTSNGECKDLVVSGNFVYIPANYYGIWKFDISNLASVPAPVSLVLPRAFYGITTDDSYLYVASGQASEEFVIVEIDSFTKTGGADLPDSHPFDVAVSGNSAFFADYLSGICYVDITAKTGDLSATVESYNFLNPVANNSQGIAVRGKFAFVTEGQNGGPGNGLHIIDVSNPAAMSLVKSYHSNGYAAAVALSGAYAYIADSDEGVQTVNIAEPGEPLLLSFTASSTAITGVAVEGDTAVLSNGAYGIKIYDVADPENTTPVWKKTVDTPNSATKCTIQGNYGYIADNMNGLQIADIGIPAEAAISGSYPIGDGSNAVNVFARGDTVFLLNYNSPYLRVIDISSPNQPDFLGGLSLSDTPKGIDFSDGLLYCSDNYLRIIDVSTTTAPFIIGTSTLPAASYDLVVRDDFAFIADNSSGLLILDISNPDNITEEGSYIPASSSVRAVDIQGDYAFIGNGEYKNLIILDISDPASSRVVAEYSVGSTIYECRVLGEYCYIASAGGMTIFDLWPWNN